MEVSMVYPLAIKKENKSGISLGVIQFLPPLLQHPISKPINANLHFTVGAHWE